MTLRGRVENLQAAVRHARCAVIPTRSGLGIKNKLLEAAAMGLPILASPRAVRGLLHTPGESPFVGLLKAAGLGGRDSQGVG